MPAGRACPGSSCDPSAGYPTSNQTSGVACPGILRCARCRNTRTRACSRSSTSAMREAACSTLARRPSLISPQVSRWMRRPPDHAMTVSTCPGASPATIAPQQRHHRRPGIEQNDARGATPTYRARERPSDHRSCPGSKPLQYGPRRARLSAGSGPSTARHPRASTPTPISARPGPALRNPGSRLRRAVQEVQGDDDREHGQGHVHPQSEMRPGHLPA